MNMLSRIKKLVVSIMAVAMMAGSVQAMNRKGYGKKANLPLCYVDNPELIMRGLSKKKKPAPVAAAVAVVAEASVSDEKRDGAMDNKHAAAAPAENAPSAIQAIVMMTTDVLYGIQDLVIRQVGGRLVVIINGLEVPVGNLKIENGARGSEASKAEAVIAAGRAEQEKKGVDVAVIDETEKTAEVEMKAPSRTWIVKVFVIGAAIVIVAVLVHYLGTDVGCPPCLPCPRITRPAPLQPQPDACQADLAASRLAERVCQGGLDMCKEAEVALQGQVQSLTDSLAGYTAKYSRWEFVYNTVQGLGSSAKSFLHLQ